MSSPILAFRDAVLALVRAVPAVRAACGNRITDTVPTTGPLARLPHVSCGPANWNRGETGALPLGVLRLRLFVASGEPTRDQVWTIAHAIMDALEGASPALAGDHHLIDLVRVVQAGDVLDKLAPNEVFLDISTIVQRNP